MSTTRRGFMKLLGLGAASVAVAEVIEPVRKLWFVGSNAPVGSRIERVELIQTHDAVRIYQSGGIETVVSGEELDYWRRLSASQDRYTSACMNGGPGSHPLDRAKAWREMWADERTEEQRAAFYKQLAIEQNRLLIEKQAALERPGATWSSGRGYYFEKGDEGAGLLRRRIQDHVDEHRDYYESKGMT